MPTLAIAAITLGFDSARASAALSLRPLTAARAACLALAFGAFDGASSFAGLIAGGSIIHSLEPHMSLGGAVLLAAYGLWLAVEPFECTPGTQLWVPAALSLDNLGAGLALAGSGPAYAVAVVLGVTSVVLASIGFLAGGVVRAHIPESAARLSGVALLGIAGAQATVG
jgi:manganese efflux pump family protein